MRRPRARLVTLRSGGPGQPSGPTTRVCLRWLDEAGSEGWRKPPARGREERLASPTRKHGARDLKSRRWSAERRLPVSQTGRTRLASVSGGRRPLKGSRKPLHLPALRSPRRGGMLGRRPTRGRQRIRAMMLALARSGQARRALRWLFLIPPLKGEGRARNAPGVGFALRITATAPHPPLASARGYPPRERGGIRKQARACRAEALAKAGCLTIESEITSAPSPCPQNKNARREGRASCLCGRGMLSAASPPFPSASPWRSPWSSPPSAPSRRRAPRSGARVRARRQTRRRDPQA